MEVDFLIVSHDETDVHNNSQNTAANLDPIVQLNYFHSLVL